MRQEGGVDSRAGERIWRVIVVAAKEIVVMAAEEKNTKLFNYRNDFQRNTAIRLSSFNRSSVIDENLKYGRRQLATTCS